MNISLRERKEAKEEKGMKNLSIVTIFFAAKIGNISGMKWSSRVFPSHSITRSLEQNILKIQKNGDKFVE